MAVRTVVLLVGFIRICLFILFIDYLVDLSVTMLEALHGNRNHPIKHISTFSVTFCSSRYVVKGSNSGI